MLGDHHEQSQLLQPNKLFLVYELILEKINKKKIRWEKKKSSKSLTFYSELFFYNMNEIILIYFSHIFKNTERIFYHILCNRSRDFVLV